MVRVAGSLRILRLGFASSTCGTRIMAEMHYHLVLQPGAVDSRKLMLCARRFPMDGAILRVTLRRHEVRE